MNNRFENSDEALIDAALGDQTWSAFDSRLRTGALKSFASAKRCHRLRRLTAHICGLLFLAGAAIWFARIQSEPPSTVKTATNSNRNSTPAPRSVISEQQMLDMFPPGSCLLAEINGEKQLVFLDPQLARQGFPVAANR